MKVILTQELKGKGGEGDVVEVAQGFADNYLLPNGLAIKATKGNLKQLEMRMHNIQKREVVRLETADDVKKALEGKSVTIVAKVGEDGQLFGSITPAMISEAMKDQLGIEIDRKKIDLNKPIKQAGEHTVTVSIYREIKGEVGVLVKSEEEVEAEAAAAAEAEAAKAAEEASEAKSAEEVETEGESAAETTEEAPASEEAAAE